MTEPTENIPNAELLAAVLSQMSAAGRPLFNHEFDFKALGVSENNLGSRWCEWEPLGLVHSPAKGKNGMKAWAPGPDPRRPLGQAELAAAPRSVKAEVLAVCEEPLLGQQIVTLRLPAWPLLKPHDYVPVRMPRTA